MLRIAWFGAAFILTTLLLLPVQALAVALRSPAQRHIPILFHRLMCRLLGVRITVVGARCAKTPLLIVANHTSWLDISVITALLPAVFVAKSEVARWPLFGLFAKLQRSVFVDRSRRHTTARVNAEIASRVTGGDPVVLFGEGTSSDGNRVLPFRTALIGSAEEALRRAPHAPVYLQPLSLAYTGLHGLPIGRQHRPVVSWYGGFSLLPHLANVARQGAIDVVVSFGEPIAFCSDSDRKQTAQQLETAVRQLTAAALHGRRRAPGRDVAQDEVVEELGVAVEPGISFSAESR